MNNIMVRISNDIIRKYMTRIPLTVWFMIAIVAAGAFLRMYQFHDWLHFGSDQSRDAAVIELVALGKAGWPAFGAEASSTHFYLGPIHYYFQILSVKWFGVSPEAMVYPDVFFSILAIPLLFVLLRRLFSVRLSLSLTALYAVSYYAVEYSRFAWNCNAIPFFAVLFLLALHEFAFLKEKTGWIWVGVLGAAFGVGVQLHVLLLLIWPVMLMIVFTMSVMARRIAWTRWAAIIAIAILCNAGQLISEWQTNGANTKLFFSAFDDRSSSSVRQTGENALFDVLCHGQAYWHIVSSSGNDSQCDIPSKVSDLKKVRHIERHLGAIASLVAIFAISVAAYIFLMRRIFLEHDPKRRMLLTLIAAYMLLAFIAVFPTVRDMPLRYFLPEAIFPFILFGLFYQTFCERYRKYGLFVMIAIVISLAGMNIRALLTEASDLSAGTRGDSGYAVLGETERMVEYMVAYANGQQEAYLSGSTWYLLTYYKTLTYLAEKKGLELSKIETKHLAPRDGKIIFFIGEALSPKDRFERKEYLLKEYKNFGNIGIFVVIPSGI
jgi:hypothetical protein